MYTLRPYQVETIERTREAIRKGARRVLIQAPTGAGKTLMASEIIRSAMLKGSVTWFVAHQGELIEQASEKLIAFGVHHAIVLPGHWPDGDEHTYVGTIQSFTSRIRRGRLAARDPNLIVIDEAHRALAPSYMRLVRDNPSAVVLGITATPIRTDGRGLGHLFEAIVQTPTIRELIEAGYLVPPRYYAPYRPDLESVRVVAGDYVESDLDRVMNRPTLVGDVAEWYLRLAHNRQGIVFGSSVAHSVALAEAMQDAGIKAVHLDGQTDKRVRAERMEEFRAGKIQVLCNFGIAVEGLDVPEVGAVVIARPTKSVKVYLQMAGRALRPHPGKTDCLIIDHAGVTYEHGPITDWTRWTLSMERGAGAIKDGDSATKRTKICPSCKAIFWASIKSCPECGYTPQGRRNRGEYPDWQDGELVEIVGKEARKLLDKQEWFQKLRHIQEARGYKPGWTAHCYRRKWNSWPDRSWWALPSIVATPDVLGWLEGQTKRYWIARRKAREKYAKD